ncbi:MAG: polyribonucleotide nucleotidyltransferase, partial [Acholeplasmataceae bacterium]|nr:polyribonucleotide nucleotidyltransferase [Acholeplasmataceae bacterium]
MNSYSMQLGGRTLSIETGKFAKQANGSVMVRYGDTAVVVAVTGAKVPREGVDFFPLTVDFEEKMYAVGKIPGGFIKREGRPSEAAILTSRMIDRPIRPMFPDGYRNDVQIVATAVSVDQDNPPDIVAMLGASCALSISDIPFDGPIAGIRIGLIDGKFIINPNVEETKASELSLAVAGTRDAILMVEAGAKEVSEEVMLDAIWFAHDVIKELVAFQDKIQAEIGKPKMEVPVYVPPAEIAEEIRAYGQEKLKAVLMDSDKLRREEMVDQVKAEIAEVFNQKYPENGKDVAYITQKLIKTVVRRTISVDKIRPDGRQLDEVRTVTCEVGLLARPHGSSLFTRGQTQILNALALAPLREVQIIDGLGVEDTKRYIHHYNFPPYSVGETKPLRSPGRREIGHGALAERALLPVIPSEEDFPYAIRLVSEVLESNGSSSMGSVCGSTLSLMDAGVPIKAPVSGVAMGLVKDGDDFAILTDIQGLEDALGDMDFKVAGTENGI